MFPALQVSPLAKSLAALLCPRERSCTKRPRPDESAEADTVLRRQTPADIQVLLALPDRTDFGRTVSAIDPEPLPDYEVLLEALKTVMPRPLCVDRIGSIPPSIAGTLTSHIDLLLLSVAK